MGALTPELLEGISIKQRFWMIDPKTGAHKESSSDMAYKAVKQALDTVGLKAKDVDMMVLATGTPEYPLPPTVNLVQEKMGLEKCFTLELRSGGAGGVQGLDIARYYLENGIGKTAVVIGVETISPAMVPIFLGKNPDSIRMRERLPLYMFGDGAGAMVLQSREDGPPGLLGAASASIGGTRKPGIWAIGGGSHAPVHEQIKARRFPELRVDVVEAGKYTPHMITDALAETLARGGVPVESSRLVHDPGRERRLDVGRAQGIGPAHDGVGGAGRQDLRQPGHDGGRGLRGRPALPRRRLAHGKGQAGPTHHAGRHRGHEVDLRRDRDELDGPQPEGRRMSVRA